MVCLIGLIFSETAAPISGQVEALGRRLAVTIAPIIRSFVSSSGCYESSAFERPEALIQTISKMHHPVVLPRESDFRIFSHRVHCSAYICISSRVLRNCLQHDIKNFRKCQGRESHALLVRLKEFKKNGILFNFLLSSTTDNKL